MNVYEVYIWRSVKRSGEFSHNAERVALVHARNEAEAKGKVELEPPKVYGESLGFVEISGEFIYSVTKTGTVTKQLMYVYSDGRSPRPTKGR